MSKITVDADGKIIIPPEVVSQSGLRPGDALYVSMCEDGFIAQRSAHLAELEQQTRGWFDSLSEEERRAVLGTKIK